MAADKKYISWVEQFLKVREGLKPGAAYKVLHDLGYDRTYSTLRHQVQRFVKTGHVLLTMKRTGAKPALSEAQEEILKVWIDGKNSKNERINLRDLQAQIDAYFDVKVSLSTCSSVMRRMGMSRKKCLARRAGFKMDHNALVEMYWNWIVMMRKTNRFYLNPSLIYSLDVTFTTAPDSHYSWSLRGSGIQMSNDVVAAFTDAIVTGICGAGGNPAPCLLFTHNPRFNINQKDTPRGRRLTAEFLAACKKYNIFPDRVQYTPSTYHYRGECVFMYEQFLGRYKFHSETLFLHDGGHAFKQGGKSIFESLGFPNHAQYPSQVHQYLSPNDNSLHACKATWYAEYKDFENDLHRSLRLMQLIDLNAEDNSKYFFQRNLFCVKKSDIGHILRG